MLSYILTLIVGFIAGALTFRNNARKAEKITKDGQEWLETAKAKSQEAAEEVRKALKK